VSVKDRVIARVTGIPFIPKKTVEIGPDQCVVDQLKPEWWKSAESDLSKVVAELEPKVNQDFDEHFAPAYREALVELGQPLFATGGIIPNTKPVIIGEHVSDHVLPKVLVDQLMTAGEKQLQSSQSETEIRDEDFLLDFSDTLITELETVLNPDVRAIHYPAPVPTAAEIDAAFQKLGEFYETNVVWQTAPVGAPDSSEICEQDENMVEYSARQPFELRSSQVNDRLRKIAPELENQKPTKVQGVELTDYEQAAELGMSVHAYRFITREISLLQGRIKTVKRQAVTEAVNRVRESYECAISTSTAAK
jgi:hypothetical protein